MSHYQAPLRDMRFVLFELLPGDDLFKLPGMDGLTRQDVDVVLDQAARLCEEVIAPRNRDGDEEGCRFESGTVITPAGFKPAFAAYRDGGWSLLSCHPDDGGQGLPHVVQTMFDEMQSAANLAFTSYVGLTQAAYVALRAHGSADLRARYLPALAEARWTGTMCLTEPQAGTDLSLLKTSARPRGDGSYAITGTKIFISAGEHDLAENIIHLVLARLPEAPPGVKGISLFLVPKFPVGDDGALGPRNAVSCGAIEHKMGLKGSATCVMNFDGATGWLVGEPHQGLAAMFSMMNTARLAVAMQGIGLGEVSHQRALAYARDRIQGQPPNTDQPGAIIGHPDVKRMLLTQKAYVEGMRALAGWIGMALDTRDRDPDPTRRQAADHFVALMTPIAKALCTDLGFEVTNLGVQVLGGHGYIRENGLEQYVRDGRIGQLYEGTNGVQAQDLVRRKLRPDMVACFMAPLEAFLAEQDANAGLSPVLAPLIRAHGLLKVATRHMQGQTDTELSGAVATDYLRLFGLVALGFLWARAALLAQGRDDPFYRAKSATAAFFAAHLLAQTEGLAHSIAAGGDTLAAFDISLF